MHKLSILTVLGLLAGIGLGHAQAPDDPDYRAMPEGEGRDLAYIYCSACHSLKLVTQQGLDRDDWDEVFVWMVDEQGMPETPEPDRTRLLDYLAEFYGPDRKARQVSSSGPSGE